MSFIYTRSQLKSRVNAAILGRIGMLLDEDETMNDAVRDIRNFVDLRSLRRRSLLVSPLAFGRYDYVAPSDLDAQKLIALPSQAMLPDGQFFLVPSNEFNVQRRIGTFALDQYNGMDVLKIAADVNSKNMLISGLDSLTGGASVNWSAFGDAENLEADNDDFVEGSGSISFDISAAAGTTAGIQNTGIHAFDLTEYLDGNGMIFVAARINSATNITNYKLRIGSSSGNYYEKTVTAQSDGTAFVSGWNLLRFDLTSLVETGTVNDVAITYLAVFMTKTSGKVSETDYKFDDIELVRGVNHYVKYYSKYGWQSIAGAYKQNSTSDDDVLVADDDEYSGIILKASEYAANEIKDYDLAAAKAKAFELWSKEYKMKNPSEAKIMTNEYYVY